MNPPALTPGFWTGRRVVCAAGVLGLLWYLALGGAPSLDPTNLHPMGSGDHSQHVLGWLLLRNEPWSFPLGRVSALMHPLGGSGAALFILSPTARSLLRPLTPLFEPLRASGRFIWPLHYLALWGAIALGLRGARGRPGVAGALRVGPVVVQAGDLPGAWSGRYAPSGVWPRLRDAAWTGLGQGPYRHLVLFPPLATASLSNCGDVEFSYADSMRFGDLAYRERLTVNSGYLARRDERGIQAYCDALRADVAAGRFARDAVYVVHPQRLDLFTRAGSGMVCGLLEGYQVCVAADVPSPFREALASGTRRP